MFGGDYGGFFPDSAEVFHNNLHVINELDAGKLLI